MELWIVGAILALLILRQLWKAYTHPAHVLGRQAANMNWVACGTAKDSDGYRNTKLQRDGFEVVISFVNENVELTSSPHPSPFKDFIELERWLTQNDDVGEVSSDTKIALEELEKELHGEYMIAFNVIAPEIKSILTDSNGKAVSVQLNAGFTYNEIVHLAAKFILDRKLPSGEHHVYRGVLDIAGNDMWELYQACLYILSKPLEADEETIQKEISVMKHAITEAG